jgi:hypothetical protein
MNVCLPITSASNVPAIFQSANNHPGNLLSGADVIKPAKNVKQGAVLSDLSGITPKMRADILGYRPKTIMRPVHPMKLVRLKDLLGADVRDLSKVLLLTMGN